MNPTGTPRSSAFIIIVTLTLTGCSTGEAGEPAPGSRGGSVTGAGDSGSAHGAPDSSAKGDGVWGRLVARPLDIPRIGPGEKCPVTRQWTPRDSARLSRGVLPGRPLLGQGPVYPGPTWRSLRRHVVIRVVRDEGGSLNQKVLWAVDASYHGPVLIRGRQVDGPQVMTFSGGLSTGPRQLRFRDRTQTSNFFVPSPGCYAVQIDGVSFSRVIVFRTRLARTARGWRADTSA